MLRRTLALFIACITFVAVIGACSQPNELAAVTLTELSDSDGMDKLQAILPSEWTLLDDKRGIAEGNLNDDGFPDVAAILEWAETEADEAPQRALLIALGTSDSSYGLSIIAEGALLKSDEGGIWGDPFDSLVIENESVIVNHYGGSAWRWHFSHTYQIVEQEWVLAELTSGGEQIPEGDDWYEEKIDYLTGEYTRSVLDENGQPSTEQETIIKKELIKLKDFNLLEELLGEEE